MKLQAILTIFGGLGLFLFGMKYMSESLQRAAGNNLKALLNRMTTNKFAAALSGTAITTTIQSSSATTVMVVGFVNAALLDLRQAIGVIMGANIGTTFTAWLVAFLGFKFKIDVFALPAVAVGFTMLFFRRERVVVWGETLIGFGLMFLGLYFLKSAVPDYKSDPEAFVFLRQYSDMGFLSILLFVFIGTFLTVIVQSSSTTSAITITLAVKGHLGMDLALAMILGENIGTTITANLAALAGNLNSKKAALAHTLFNVFGVIWVLLLFNYILKLLPLIIPGNPLEDPTLLGFYISVFHSGFNITNTLLLIWFIPQIESMVSRIVEKIGGGRQQEQHAFKLLFGGSVRATELSSLELISYHHKSVEKALSRFNLVEEMVAGDYSRRKYQAIMDLEDDLDHQRDEMVAFLNEIQESGVSGETARTLQVVGDQVRVLEQISDIFARIARKLRRADKKQVSIEGDRNRQAMKEHLDLLRMHHNLISAGLAARSLQRPATRERSLEYRRQSKKRHRRTEKRIQKSKYIQKYSAPSLVLIADLSRLLDDVSHSFHLLTQAGE